QTRARSLPLFVLASSAAGVLGSPGQCGYAAANAALYAIAAARRAEGEAAVAVAYGPWAGEGMAARRPGPGRLEPEEALAATEAPLASGAARGVVAPLADLLPPEAADRPMLAEALRRGRVSGLGAVPDLRARIEAAPERERARLLAGFVREGIRRALGLAP